MTRRVVTNGFSDSFTGILKDMVLVLHYSSYWVTYALKSFPDEELREVALQCTSRQELMIVEERIRSLMALHHPNIVKCMRAFVCNSLLYCRTKRYNRPFEHKRKQNLRESCRMSEGRMLYVVCQIA